MTSRVNIVVSRRARYMCLGGALSKGRGRGRGEERGGRSPHLAAGIFIVHNSRYAARPITRDIILPGRESNRDNGIGFPGSAIDDTPRARHMQVEFLPRCSARDGIFTGYPLKVGIP